MRLLRKVFAFSISIVCIYWIYSTIWVVLQSITLFPGVHEVHLGNRVLHMPQKYWDAIIQMPDWVTSIEGVEENPNSILMEIKADEIAASVPGYITRNLFSNEDMNIIIEVLEPGKVKAILAPPGVKEIWTKTNSYQNRFVQLDPDTGYFRVHQDKKYDQWWVVLKVNPETQAMPSDLFSYQVGRCLESDHGGVTGNFISCTSDVIFENIYIHFRTNGKNIKHVDEIRAFLIKLVGGWLDLSEKSGQHLQD